MAWGEVLLESDDPLDSERGHRLLEQALCTASRLGMAGIERGLRALPARHDAATGGLGVVEPAPYGVKVATTPAWSDGHRPLVVRFSASVP